MKIIKRIFIILIIILITIITAIWFLLKHQSPVYSGEIVFEDLEEKAEVLFDEYGIPHIYAQNEQDAYFALGYVQAQERLFQMELYRRLIQGRASEIFGEALIPTDKYFLTLGLNKLAKEAAKKHFSPPLDQDFQKPVIAYLKGINAFVAEDRLPVEFALIGIEPEPFTVEDMYASLNLTALGFSFAQNDDLLMNYIYHDLGEEYMKDFSTDFIPQDPQAYVKQLMGHHLERSMEEIGLPIWEGSNAWVIAPSKTKSGKAVFANDTHIGFSQPAIWYEAHIHYPGFEFYGSFLPMVPYGIIGHNRKLAWGMTIFPFDNMDYVNLESYGDPSSYIYDQDTLSYEFIDYEIKVKGARSEKFTLQKSALGPVINHLEPIIDSLYPSKVALNWSLYHLDLTAVQAVYQMNRAQNMKEFRAALPLIDIVGLNVMYADIEDNIAWWACGKIPKRDSLSRSFMFLNSANELDKYERFLSFDENPYLVNPSQGFVATANNNPVLSGSHFVRGNYLPADRIHRINQALLEKNDWDVEACKRLQLDHQSTVKRDLAHFISAQLIDLPQQGAYLQAAEVLSNWDGNYDLDAIAPTIFEKMYFHIGQQTLADELGPQMFKRFIKTYMIKKTLPVIIENEHSLWWQKKNADERTSRDQILTLAFMISIDELSRDLGSQVENWTWDQVNSLTHEHPVGKRKPMNHLYNVGPFPVAGGNQVLNKMSAPLTSDLIHQVSSGPALRLIIDFADVTGGLNISPTGQSGNFYSPHYSDQAEMFVDGEYRAMLMDRNEVEAIKHQVLLLKPE